MAKQKGPASADGEVVIVDAVRTAIGGFLGALAPLSAPQLGAAAIRALLERNPNLDRAAVDEVILGNVLTAGVGQNPARQAALGAGLPDTIPAYTLNMVCGSGLRAVMEAANAIRAGTAQVVIAGGAESMSNAPYLLKGARTGYRMGNGELVDSMVADGLWDVYNNFHMGNTAELVAEKYGLSREAQDAYALASHQKAVQAADAGRFKSEIVPVAVPQRKGDPLVFAADENPRRDTSMEKLARLKPVFRKDGTVTAGNASSIADGAGAVLLASAEAARRLGLKPLARITGQAASGIEPKWIMLAPIGAVRKLLAATGRAVGDFDLVELNEAFSAQPLAVLRELGIPAGKVNVNGGAVALGHPIGCSGARLLATLVHAMRDRSARLGLAALCIGGGNAVAVSVELC